MNMMKWFHRRGVVWALALLIGALGSAALFVDSSSACSSMGPDKHVGIVKEIHLDRGVLTLIDAETGRPIQFTASTELLKEARINKKATITFKKESDRLAAQNIEVR